MSWEPRSRPQARAEVRGVLCQACFDEACIWVPCLQPSRCECTYCRSEDQDFDDILGGPR